MQTRAIVEVQVPLMGQSTTSDVYIDSFDVADGKYLQTSPEFFLKRLLASGMSCCYYLGPAFRRGEAGRWHNPEFTILEWYRLGYSSAKLRAELAELIEEVLGVSDLKEYQFHEFLQQFLNVDISIASDEELYTFARNYDYFGDVQRADLIDFLYGIALSENTNENFFVRDFPVEIPGLAATTELLSSESRADRFELIIQGLEIANGYYELRDVHEFKRRVQEDNVRRKQQNQPTIALDPKFLAAMEYGIPRCSGVAVGIDRLFALATEASTLDQVLAFPVNRL